MAQIRIEKLRFHVIRAVHTAVKEKKINTDPSDMSTKI